MYIKLISIYKRYNWFGFFLSVFVFIVMVSSGFASVYEVGPQRQFEYIRDVPFDDLKPGDIVKIYYKKNGYKEKFIIKSSGTKNNPIKIIGIPSNGKLPRIDGSHAIQFQKDLSEQEGVSDQSGRWLIKVGDKVSADYIGIYNLELRNANNSQEYSLNNKFISYSANAAGVFVKFGKHVIISGCIIHACGNGVQTSYAPNVSNITISKCVIYDNGNHKRINDYLEHNIYMCAPYTKIQFSRFGEPHSNGNNIKDRGLNTIIRYNWIEGGKNRQIDLVDHETYKKSNAYVYGNVIVQGNKINNRNMIHFGGDSGHSRSGSLFFFNNTVVGKSFKTRYFVTRFDDCGLVMTNNVFVGKGVLWNDKGFISGSNNWFSNTIFVPEAKTLGTKGISPGFTSVYGIPFIPRPGSDLINKGSTYIPIKIKYQPKLNSGGFPRRIEGLLDIGAYESILKNIKPMRNK
ncbi:MAG: hypothetical protein GY857_12890 [Desulfobacula sp.]|nr:hypothetical protein [Desulfobacula sp.]